MEVIQRTVGMSQANYEAAAAIERSLEPPRAEMMRQVFQEIEAQFFFDASEDNLRTGKARQS